MVVANWFNFSTAKKTKSISFSYIENGDYVEFFQCLEYVIKARTTVSEFAKKVGMNRVQLVDILHGRTKTPSLVTIGKILSGLGYKIDLKSA